MLIKGENSQNGSSDANSRWDLGTVIQRWAKPILFVLALVLPVLLWGASKSLRVYKSDIHQWLPQGFEEAKVYEKFVKLFGVDEMVVISWPGAVLDDPLVPAFQRALLEQQLDGNPMFLRVVSGPELLSRIENANVSENAALNRVAGLLVGPDLRTTCVIAYPNENAFEEVGHLAVDRVAVMERIFQVAAEEPFNLSVDELKLGGPTIDGAVLEVETQRSMNRFLWITVVAVFLMAWFRLRDLWLTLLGVSFSLFCAILALAILYFGGGKMNMTMILLPTLSFILGISGCVHMINYYRKAVAIGFGENAAGEALRNGFKPVLFSSFTTSIGMFSLGVSQVEPIRSFGFFAGMAILASLIVILILLPAAIHVLRDRLGTKYLRSDQARREQISGVSRSMSLLVNWVCREHGLVVIPMLIGLSIISVGVFKLKGSVKIQSRFADRVKILQDYEWLEENLGPLVPLEIVLSFSAENELSDWQKMQMVKAIERSVRKTTAVKATFSVATFEPALPRGDRLFARGQRRMFVDRWKGEFPAFEEAKLLKRTGEGSSSWRISVRVAALNDIDYGSLIETLQKNVNHQLDEIGQPGVSATLTGGIPLIYKAQRQILDDLLVSFLTAFIFISIVMMVVLRGVIAGLVSMLPNVFPPLIVFGAMGWMGKKVEIGSVLTASVALGIAVDDTVHFLTWFRRSLAEGNSRYKAIRHSFDHCAKAMIDTSFICCVGVAPFLFSVFMPTFNFALLLSVMLLAALVGDLLLLPALLAGPFGGLLRHKSDRQSLKSPVEQGGLKGS